MTGVAEVRFRVDDPAGLHARPAARFVQAATRFQSRIQLSLDQRSADCKSLLSLLGLAVRPGSEIVLRAEGDDASLAVSILADELAPYVTVVDVGDRETGGPSPAG